MSFAEFRNIPQVQTKYAIRYCEKNFMQTAAFDISDDFRQMLDFNLLHLDTSGSDAARCETVIFPILREVYRHHAENFALWVQKSIRVDDDLNGSPDYMVSRRSAYGKLCLEHPLLAVTCAKKNDFELGWGQCLSELIAAQKLNDDESLPVYGVVTDGCRWEFGYLNSHEFCKNIRGFDIDELPELLGSLEFVFQQLTNLSEN